MGRGRSAVVDELEDCADGGLRIVAEYDQDGYEFIFARPDVRERRTESQIDQVHQDMVLQGLGKDALEQLFEAGPLQCSIHRFEEITVFHFVRDDRSGIFVSIDSDAHVDIVEFVEVCRELL